MIALRSDQLVELESAAAGGTRPALAHSRFAEDEARDEHVDGWTGRLAKLEDMWSG